MSVSVLAPVTQITLNGSIPYVLQSCVLVAPVPTPDPEPGPELEEFIFAPVPPGIDLDSLPIIDPETQIIDTSPNQVIGCANDLPVGVEQQILEALFPGAEAGDGIVNRDNNDVWTYDGSTWTNVGPTPGPQIVQVSILPPWNEIVFLSARVRTRLSVQSLAYALDPPDVPISIVVRTTASVTKLLNVPSIAYELKAYPPYFAGTIIQLSESAIDFALYSPQVSTGYSCAAPVSAITLASLTPLDIGTGPLFIQPQQLELLIEAQAPRVVAPGPEIVIYYPDEPPILSSVEGVLFEDFSSPGVYSVTPFQGVNALQSLGTDAYDGPYWGADFTSEAINLGSGPCTIEFWWRAGSEPTQTPELTEDSFIFFNVYSAFEFILTLELASSDLFGVSTETFRISSDVSTQVSVSPEDAYTFNHVAIQRHSALAYTVHYKGQLLLSWDMDADYSLEGLYLEFYVASINIPGTSISQIRTTPKAIYGTGSFTPPAGPFFIPAS
jgi:hypothetical protein